jgi:DeoR/GlpR family transcriptional regulator of sugar metabolism
LARRQLEVWNIIEERREILLSELVALAETTAATVRKLEDRGLDLRSRMKSPSAIRTRGSKFCRVRPIMLNPAQAVASGEDQEPRWLLRMED